MRTQRARSCWPRWLHTIILPFSPAVRREPAPPNRSPAYILIWTSDDIVNLRESANKRWAQDRAWEISGWQRQMGYHQVLAVPRTRIVFMWTNLVEIHLCWDLETLHLVLSIAGTVSKATRQYYLRTTANQELSTCWRRVRGTNLNFALVAPLGYRQPRPYAKKFWTFWD